MGDSTCLAKPPEPLEVTSGNPAHSWEKWKRKFDIFLRASGASTKPGVQKVGLLLNHIGEQAVDIFANFIFLAARADPNGEGANPPQLPAEDEDDYDTVIGKYDLYFTKRDPQLMLRERFWLHLKREPGQSFDAWVNAVRKHAAECKFPANFLEQAVRDKITFECNEDSSKLKLYDVGAKLSLEKAVQILSVREATNRELKESKTTTIDAVRARQQGPRQKQWHKPQPNKSPSTPQKGQAQSARPGKTCGYCGTTHMPGIRNCPAAKIVCTKCKKKGHYSEMCRSSVGQVGTETGPSAIPTFIGVVQYDKPKDPGWHVRLRAGSATLAWCIDTGAQVSVMPESAYKEDFGKLEPAERRLVGAGETPLETIGCVNMVLKHGETRINEQVYVVRGATKLLLGVPGIRNLGLIHEIPGTFSVRAVESKPCPKLDTKDKVIKTFPQLFTGLGKLKGEHEICMKPDVTPFCLTSPRRVPLPLLKKVEQEIQRLVELDVIEPVSEPTDWCSPIVVVPKPNHSVRMCVDMTVLNRGVKREVYPIPDVETTLGRIAQGSIYSKLDANSGFHQVVLEPQSRRLTTFITPFGRFMYKRLPYGITSAPEHYQKRMEQILGGLEGVVCKADDILIYGRHQTEHDERLFIVLRCLADAGATLNVDKCEISLKIIKYLGQIIDGAGIRKDPDKVRAIVEYQQPQDVTELRRFLGMVNQLMKFSPYLAELTQPLRDLLKKGTAWLWDSAQEIAFSATKRELASERTLVMYDPERETTVSADASSYGLGAVLLQKHAGILKPVAFASRAMTATERRYAQIEKEALATTWALERWQDFLIGMSGFMVETDHKPLVPLLSTKLIDELPIRIQRFRMRLMRFDFKICHVPGKYLYTADALSRSPLEGDGEHELEKEVEYYVNAVIVNFPASDARLEEIRCELKTDEVLKVVMYYVEHGWPKDKAKLYGSVKKYWCEQGNLNLHDNLLLYGKRLVIPEKLRCNVLRYLHDGHQGIAKTRQNAVSSVWWPGIGRDIEKMVKNCITCEKFRKSRIEPMRGTDFPDRPWSRVAADFFHQKATIIYY